MNILEIKDVKKYYGKKGNQVKALDGINLSIEKGKFTAIIGSSGSGKTTLLNMMGALDRPDSGSVIVDGINLAELKEEELAIFRRHKVGFIFQSYNLIPTLMVYENIVFPMDLDNTEPDKLFLKEMIQLLKLEDRLNAYPHELSGGQQQRVAIARALAAKPAIILADEPTGNLDSKTGQNVAGLLKMSAQALHQTLILITHNLDFAMLADTVLHLEDGRIVKSEDFYA